MRTVDHLRWGKNVLKRVFEVFVVWPSIALGSALFIAGLAGGTPIRDAVSSAFQWGDEAFRSAPPGTVLVASVQEAVVFDGNVVPPTRLASQFKPVSIQQAIDEATNTLTAIYWACTLTCAGLNLLVLGPRRFIGLPHMVASAEMSAGS
ncbi:hypothetical protein [Delftia sp. JD2]|uniref:hypothetical protein n=1 Tax=Delftia sp. JD2 TaxID=469553 RepID=UPI0011121871|nr:hypothetical protein [Delftia sp. JD2]